MVMKNITLIGAGMIGTELYKQLLNNPKGGVKPYAVVEYDGIYDISDLGLYTNELTNRTLSQYLSSEGKKLDRKLKIAEVDKFEDFLKNSDTDVVAVLITTKDDGSAAANYFRTAFKYDIPVVTCEKGALSASYEEFIPQMKNDMLGYTASVGGSSLMLPILRRKLWSGDLYYMYAVLNATLNYICHQRSKGKKTSEAIEEAKAAGYAEPQGEGLNIINIELTSDIPKKVTIVGNEIQRISGRYGFIKKGEIKIPSLSEKDFAELGNVRYVLAFENLEKVNNVVNFKGLGKFEYKTPDDLLRISGAFINLEENDLEYLAFPNEFNGARISLGPYGTETFYGEGAGPRSTAATGIEDTQRMIHRGIIK